VEAKLADPTPADKPSLAAAASGDAVPWAEDPAMSQPTPANCAGLNSATIPPQSRTPEPDFAELIRSLGALRDEGLLTQEEFDEKKRSILDHL